MRLFLAVGGDDHVGGLDDRGDPAALAEAELLDGLDCDRGDQPLAGHVEDDVGDRRALVDALDRARKLIACAELHVKPPKRGSFQYRPRNRRRGERSVSSTVSEKQSRDVAEAARESEWKLPSFGKELFLG